MKYGDVYVCTTPNPEYYARVFVVNGFCDEIDGKFALIADLNKNTWEEISDNLLSDFDIKPKQLEENFDYIGNIEDDPNLKF